MTSDFGKEVKIRLIELGKSQKWLREQVTQKTGGMFLDSSYFQKIMNGERSPEKIVTAIREILGIREEIR